MDLSTIVGVLLGFALIVAAMLMGAVLLIDEWLRFPMWLMGLIVVPLTIATVLAALRFFKTVLLMASYQRSLETKDMDQ